MFPYAASPSRGFSLGPEAGKVKANGVALDPVPILACRRVHCGDMAVDCGEAMFSYGYSSTGSFQVEAMVLSGYLPLCFACFRWSSLLFTAIARDHTLPQTFKLCIVWNLLFSP
jgi:hypothetical protein